MCIRDRILAIITGEKESVGLGNGITSNFGRSAENSMWSCVSHAGVIRCQILLVILLQLNMHMFQHYGVVEIFSEDLPYLVLLTVSRYCTRLV